MRYRGLITGLLSFLFVAPTCADAASPSLAQLKEGFLKPEDRYRPGVYWYFMDGNLSRDGMTSDLQSMKDAGLGHAVFLEVNVGVPRGTTDFLSDEWQDLFVHMIREAKRIGIDITLGVGPGWAGSGGPWVKGNESMRHLVTTHTVVQGGSRQTITLLPPPPKPPFFGEGSLTPQVRQQWADYYEDVAVLAFPHAPGAPTISDINERALYYRAPYTSQKGVPPFLPPISEKGTGYDAAKVIDLTDKLTTDGLLTWDAPPGDWVVMRLGVRNNGAITRPAPVPGLGFEADKFSTSALQAHLDAYVGKLVAKLGDLDVASPGGLKRLHIDSWEMGAQNWTSDFREQFTRRRGYDPLPYLPTYSGIIVDSVETTERFLWDLRQTAQELVIENHVGYLKDYAGDKGLKLSIEPYDMNPNSDLALGAAGDIPMCEFWSEGHGFNSAFSCIEAASIGHVNGSSLIQAEAFTGEPSEAWNQYPASMKNQGDWAFAMGINQFYYHTFQHQPLSPDLLPGMTMGPYGVHWDRNQTFWPMVRDYHDYVARCQFLLQQGTNVADIVYLVPEDSPHVFRPPASAMDGSSFLPDKKGYSFDGCTPDQLMQAQVRNGHIVFAGGAQYKVLILPQWPTMTNALADKIMSLARDGATIIGNPPQRTPGLHQREQNDRRLRETVQGLWGDTNVPAAATQRTIDRGQLAWGGDLSRPDDVYLYPSYEATRQLLDSLGHSPDFSTAAPIRYIHRKSDDWDIYFLSNRTSETVRADCAFRVSGATSIEHWNPLTCAFSRLNPTASAGQLTTITLSFGPHESAFVLFTKTKQNSQTIAAYHSTPKSDVLETFDTPWTVTFDTKLGGPEEVTFDILTDWTTHSDERVRFYSGIATYKNQFTVSAAALKDMQVRVDLGTVHDLARVRINGKDAGTAWCWPWQLDVTDHLRTGQNTIEIDVANRWINRLIGDANLPDDGPQNNLWPQWLLDGKPRPGKRLTFTTYHYYKADNKLQPAGLVGPVKLYVSHR